MPASNSNLQHKQHQETNMTTYTLDTNQNTINAGNGTDIFQGLGGGNDSLRGNGGNDMFDIQTGQTGLIDGGTGYDRIHMTGAGYTNLDAGMNITGVEELIVDSTNLMATVAQLKGFTHFGVNNDADTFSMFLQGTGGTLDFSNSFVEPQALNIEAVMATSRVVITGSDGKDQIIGSDFGDWLNGGKGNDTVYGEAGSDVLNGGLGRDTLYGGDGKDAYVFDTAVSASNVDHLGEFRPLDDSIRLDDAVFQWTGQALGTLKQNEFKVIGNGQTIDADDHILYNQNTGAMYYDADGSGGQSAKLFAIADNFSGDLPVLTYQDFIII
jgi:Ca2+-binding RTX toxin-like protein